MFRVGNGWADEGSVTFLKTEHFDKDPGWEGYNNRMVPERTPVVRQDFGYSETNFAGEKKVAIGGRVQRSTIPAFFVERIVPKTLDDKLHASGTFVVNSIDGGGGGMIFGWLNSEQLPGSGDPSSFGMLLIFEKRGARISVRLHNHLNETCGTFVTPYIPGRYRPTPIRPGIRYRWTLDYDPQANKGDGQFQYSVNKVDSTFPTDDFEGLLFTVNLQPGFKKQGAIFDRFGLTNARKTGGAVEIYFNDLEYSGQSTDLSKSSQSGEGSGNRAEGKETAQAGVQDFGYSERTSFAGGAPGEIGGCFWRSEQTHGYYADHIGPLTLNDRIEVTGKVVLKTGSLDSDMALGWFNSANKDKITAA